MIEKTTINSDKEILFKKIREMIEKLNKVTKNRINVLQKGEIK